MALLALSDSDPDGDELIWTGATAPSTTNTKEENIKSLHSHIWWLVESACHVVA